MPRQARKVSELNIYHVILCGINRQIIFEEDNDYLQFISILKYYKKTRNNLSYARIDQIRTISKLNIIPPMNQYDVVGKIKCSDDIMKQIDNEIIAKFTSVDFPQFELWSKGHDQNP